MQLNEEFVDMPYSPYQFPHYSFFGVAGSTLVMTRDQGNVTIASIFNGSGAIEAWNGTGWEQTTVGSAGTNQPLYTATLSNGATLLVSGGYTWYARVTDQLSHYGVKTSVIAAGTTVWRTETETDPYGSAGFPTITSIVPLGSNGDLFYVNSSSGLTLYNNVLASCGYAPVDETVYVPPTGAPPDPIAPDRSFNANGPVTTPIDPIPPFMPS